MGTTIPYMFDIVAGRAKPARAARLMFFILLLFALIQQHNLGSGYTLVVTLAEFVSSALLLGLALKYGVGGLSKSDKLCYTLLAFDLVVWATTRNALLALHLTVIADFVSMWPTLEKTWRQPTSETPLFYWGGVIAPLLSIVAGADFSYAVILFPLYLSLINLLEIVLIARRSRA